jgi:hypothetical protein
LIFHFLSSMPSRRSDGLTTTTNAAPGRRRKGASAEREQAAPAPGLTEREKEALRAEDFSGETFQREQAREYALALGMLGAGVARGQIAEVLGVARHTVAMVEKLAYGTRQERREYLADKAYRGAAAALDVAHLKAAEGNANAMDAKRLSEAWLLLTGEASGFSEDEAEERHAFPQLHEFLVADGVVDAGEAGASLTTEDTEEHGGGE